MLTIGSELGQQLRKAFRFIGQIPELRLAQDVLPVANVADLDEPPYHVKQGGGAGFYIGPNAAEFSQGFLGLPITAQGVCVVRRVLVGAEAQCNPKLGFTDWTQASSFPQVLEPAWDQGADQDGSVRQSDPVQWRQGVSGSDFAELSLGQRIALAVANGHDTVRFDGPFVLRPGSYLVVGHNKQNLALFGTIYWDYYP